MLLELDTWILTGPSEQAFEAICGCVEQILYPEEQRAALELLQRKLRGWPAHCCRFRRIHRTHPAWPLVRSLSLRLDEWPWADEGYPQELYEDACEDGSFDKELFCDLMYEPESADLVLQAIQGIVSLHHITDLALVGVEDMCLPMSWLATMPQLCSLSLTNFYLTEPFPEIPSLQRLQLQDSTVDESVVSLVQNQTSLEELVLGADSSLGLVLTVGALSNLRKLTVHRVRPFGWETLEGLEEFVWWHVPPHREVWMDEASLAELKQLKKLTWVGPGLTPHLEGLRLLKSVTHLTLASMNLDSLDALVDLPLLEYLDLSGATFTNALLGLPGTASEVLQEKEAVLTTRDEVQLFQAMLLQASKKRRRR